MKNIIKFTLAATILTVVFTATELRAKDSDMGLTFGLDYVSNYIDRGEYYNDNEGTGGFIFPYINYNVFNTGFSAGIRAEISETWFGGSNENRDEGFGIANYNSIDINLNYTNGIENIFSFDVGFWYYRYQTMKLFDYYTMEYWSFNISYFDIYLSIAAEAIIFTPTITVTYSYYTDKNHFRGFYDDGKNEDIYVQLGFSHNFELIDSTYLDISAIAGWRHLKAGTPKSDDISDIDLSAGISTTSGILTFSTAFHYIIVPGKQYKYADNFVTDINKFFAQFGVACSI